MDRMDGCQHRYRGLADRGLRDVDGDERASLERALLLLGIVACIVDLTATYCAGAPPLASTYRTVAAADKRRYRSSRGARYGW
jgi:hypothetical protein